MIDKIKNLQKYIGMYISQQTYTHTVAYLNGMNNAYNDNLLKGFREWLIVKFDTGNNLCWDVIILQGLFEEGKIHSLNAECENNQFLIQTLFQLLNEFLSERETLGLAEIELKYKKWLIEQKWYRET